MRDTHLQALSALLDGERVSARLVQEALDDREARAWLVDAVSMREALYDEEDRGHVTWAPRPRVSPGRWLIAASVAVGITFGALGSWTLLKTYQNAQPQLPVPDKVVYLDGTQGETP